MSTVEDFATWGPRDYVQLPPMPDSWKVLDIGPGAYPLKRANVYLDHSLDILKSIDLEPWQSVMLGDLESGLPELADGEFDYVWSSHIFEHVHDVTKAAATLSRIAKRGTIVVPSIFKDAIFHMEERAHLWAVLPNPEQNAPPVFVKLNWNYINRFKDQLTQKAAAFLYRIGTNHDCTAERHLRGWFQTNESHLDVVYHWQDRLDLKVIE